MSWFDRVRSSLKQDTLAADLDEELQLHVDLKMRELMSTGFSREEARRQALRQFGNLGLVKERTRDFDTLQWMGDLVRDTRVSVRALRKTPGFTSVVLLTLALGIAANTAVFGLVNGLLFNLLPYPDSGQLMALMSRDAKGRENWTNYEDLLDWRMQSAQFSHLGGWISQSANLTGDFEPDRVRAGFVTANFLSMLGVAPAAGRDFREGEDQAGAERVVITSYGLWQGKFGGDPAFVGRQLTLNGEAFTAVGVMPQDFQFPVDTIDVWMPLPYYPNYKRDRAEINIASVGRLRTGATMKEAQAEMTGIAAALSQQYPQSNKDRGVAVHTFQEMATADVRPMLLMFWAAVGCVFLIACFNIANLSLSRVMSRERELGLRSALGASKSQIFRHLLAENLVLCLVGGAAGMLIGTAGARWLVHSQAGFLPAGFTVNLSPTIIAFSLGSAFLAALLFSGLPALHLLRGDLFDALRDGVRSAGASHSRAWLRKGLVVVELALSLTLLAGAGLLLKSFQRASGVDPGFKPENVLTLEYRMPRSKYPKPEDQVNFHYQVGERVRALPGVRTASVARAVPLSGNGAQMTFQIVGAPQPPRDRSRTPY